MIVQLDNAASSSTTSQAERDELDNKAVQEAWLSLAGTLPVSTEQSIARGEVFYSALDLAEYLIGSDDMAELANQLHDGWGSLRRCTPSEWSRRPNIAGDHGIASRPRLRWRLPQ